MIAVEEKDLQSVKTDASLYNGQPTDTGTQCHQCRSYIQHALHPEKQGWGVGRECPYA